MRFFESAKEEAQSIVGGFSLGIFYTAGTCFCARGVLFTLKCNSFEEEPLPFAFMQLSLISYMLVRLMIRDFREAMFDAEFLNEAQALTYTITLTLIRNVLDMGVSTCLADVAGHQYDISNKTTDLMI